MAQIDVRERLLTLKLVYYGPPLSGKTTNLHRLHEYVADDARGRLMTLDTRDDRTLFFDLLPVFFETAKLSFRIKIYTVPGQPMHHATRRVVLRGADGVAFVADSRVAQNAPNREAYADMLANLERAGMNPGKTPIVVQHNKRDLPDVVPEAELSAIGERLGRPLYPASALAGDGVQETFAGLVELVWAAVDRNLGLERGFGLSRADFVGQLRRRIGLAESS